MANEFIIESIDREFLGEIVKQRTKDKYFCLNDLVKIGNKQRMIVENLPPKDISQYFVSDLYKEFAKEIELEIGKKPYIAERGRYGKSWVHPYLFIDIALWFSPKIKLNVYKWLLDYLIENRIRTSDSYKYMCGTLFLHTSRKTFFANDIKKLAKMIKNKCGVEDWNKATAEQLDKRDRLHNLIGDFANVFKDSKRAVIEAFNAYDYKNGKV